MCVWYEYSNRLTMCGVLVLCAHFMPQLFPLLLRHCVLLVAMKWRSVLRLEPFHWQLLLAVVLMPLMQNNSRHTQTLLILHYIFFNLRCMYYIITRTYCHSSTRLLLVSDFSSSNKACAWASCKCSLYWVPLDLQVWAMQQQALCQTISPGLKLVKNLIWEFYSAPIATMITGCWLSPTHPHLLVTDWHNNGEGYGQYAFLLEYCNES